MAVFNATSEVVYNGTDVQEALNVLDEKGGYLFRHPQQLHLRYRNDTAGTIEIFWIMKGAG